MSVASRSPDVAACFRDAIARSHTGLTDGVVGLCVSGGGDSIAMMHLAARSFDRHRLHIVTVDHGLRAGAADEIALVAGQAARLGIAHTVLTWTWDRQGNLQAAARAGRWHAIQKWAEAAHIDTIFLGHTEDDQLETLLMRLARGSGIDGLTAMARADWRDGLRVVRPLLDMSREMLRGWLRTEGIAWCDDPSNDDPRFDRVRARQMFAQLETLGLSRKRLLQTVNHMQAAHVSLQRAAQDFARRHVRQDTGDLIFDAAALALDNEDAPRRVLAAGFSWVGGGAYRPRFDSLLEAAQKAAKGGVATLAGCILSANPGGGARLTREVSATRPIHRDSTAFSDVAGVIWDRRWFLDGAIETGLTFRALGAGVSQCPDWRNIGLPRQSLLASPSVWQDATLIAAPVAGFCNGWSARIVADFHSTAFAIED